MFGGDPYFVHLNAIKSKDKFRGLLSSFLHIKTLLENCGILYDTVLVGRFKNIEQGDRESKNRNTHRWTLNVPTAEAVQRSVARVGLHKSVVSIVYLSEKKWNHPHPQHTKN